MSAQLTLNFDASLATRHRCLRDAVASTVYASKKGLSGVAAAIDLSPTDLTKRLNGDPQRPLRAEDIEGIIAATGDITPIQFLIAKYMQDPEAQRTAAYGQIAILLPILASAMEQAGLDTSQLRRVK